MQHCGDNFIIFARFLTCYLYCTYTTGSPKIDPVTKRVRKDQVIQYGVAKDSDH